MKFNHIRIFTLLLILIFTVNVTSKHIDKDIEGNKIQIEGLAAYYPFNGNANDESGNKNDGIMNGAQITVDRFGNPNSAYYFDGSSWIVIKDNTSLRPSNSLTLCAWVKIQDCDVDNSVTVLSKQNDISDGGNFSASYQLITGHKNERGKCSMTISTNTKYYISRPVIEIPKYEWHFIVGVWNGSFMTTYFDGMLISEDTTQGNIAYDFNNLFIGRSGKAGYSRNTNFTGSIDDIRIFNKPLTQKEISTLFHINGWSRDTKETDYLNNKLKEAKVSDIKSGLVAYYPFNGNANDESGNNNNGTIYGARITGDRFGKVKSAYFFDGASYISVSDSPSLRPGNSITLCAWVKIQQSNVENYLRVISKHGEVTDAGGSHGSYQLVTGRVKERGRFYMTLKTDKRYHSTNPVSEVSLDEWHYICVMYDGNSIDTYYDGDFVSRTPGSGNIVYDNNCLYIGKDGYYNNAFFNGVIDEVRIYNRYLSDLEIKLLYNTKN